MAGSKRVGVWDDVVEEAAGELAEVEGQLHTASQQLLDLRSATAQLSADAQNASVAKDQVHTLADLLACSSFWSAASPGQICRVGMSVICSKNGNAHSSWRHMGA